MSRFHSYINTAEKLIGIYKGDQPFAIYLKQFFAANKKYGSKDRRQIAALCYNYFRMGFAGAGIPPGQKMLIGTFLCETEHSELMENLQPEWNKQISRPLPEKLTAVSTQFSLTDIFPFYKELSDGIDPAEFCKSFLVQPGLFIRIRPQTRTSVLSKLERSKLYWRLVSEDCVQLNISDNVEDFFIIDKEVVVQDYNSQKVLDHLKNGDLQIDSIQGESKLGLAVWDCCAGSGGKSILLNDIINRKIDPTVSDIRAGIILKLHQRFKKAGIKEYKYFIADISSPGFKPGEFDFDMIICDAPCSGSGTWSRTPEQLCFFKQPAIKENSSLQKTIITNALPCLRNGGLFVYITCSVFKNENEAIAGFITENFDCELLYLQLLKGYDKKADNMFVAVFRKFAK
ncbi:MAG: Fmu (Sun) domain-containing protein [Ferruginibacter sp.]